MRFKITLQVQKHSLGRELPINYQYELSAAIYRLLSISNAEYSHWLHENGFRTDNKRFRLFTFSHLIVPRYVIDGKRQRLILQSDFVEWHITFLPEKSTKHFIKGVFLQQCFQIGDKVSAVQFLIKEIQIMPLIDYKEEMSYETISPICISRHKLNNKADYLPPTDPHFAKGLLIGLLARYNAFYGREYTGIPYCDLEILTEPKSVLIKIKAGTPQQTYVRGYKFRFKIKLPEELMRIMYEAGAGEKTSMGWGMIREITPTS